MLFEIKKFKSFTGMEGPGFNADLYADGQKAAIVIDGGNGGEMDFHWTSRKSRRRSRRISPLSRRSLSNPMRNNGSGICIPTVAHGTWTGSWRRWLTGMKP
jgi:hypothetical protein